MQLFLWTLPAPQELVRCYDIYIYSFQARWRRGKTRCSEIWGATTTSWKAKAAPGLQHSDNFQPNLGHWNHFFWSFLLREYLNNHGKSYVTFFLSQPTTSPCLVVFQQINESSSSWSVSKSFWISRRWRWRLANLPQRRPFGHVFSLFAYRGISQMFPEAKKERESREKAKAFLAAEGQGLRFDLKGRTNLVCSSMQYAFV